MDCPAVTKLGKLPVVEQHEHLNHYEMHQGGVGLSERVSVFAIFTKIIDSILKPILSR